KRIEGWGDFDLSLLSKLESTGVHIRLYECTVKELKNIPEEVEYVRLAAPRGYARFAIIGRGEVPSALLRFDPQGERLSSLIAETRQLEASIAKNSQELEKLAVHIPVLDAAIDEINADLTIERLRAGMPREERLAYLSGYVPSREAGKLTEEAQKRGWAVAIDDPADEDLPPTKVENNKFVRIIQPVFDFLGTVPNYREYDISPWFLVFFSLFFAMIFGDGGYGLVMLAIALALIVRARKAGKPVGDFLKLLLVLAVSTIAWGFVSSTWFAIPWESLPRSLQALSIHAINSSPRVGNETSSDMNIRIFCFIVGTVQLGIAHIKNIKRDFPNLKFLSQVGSLLLLVGMFNLALYLVIDAERFPIHSWVLGVLGLGFLLVFVFSNWNGNLLKSILATLINFIPTLLGVVSVFADIVSYIRLWAVGLTGLAISQTINGMAMGILGTFGGSVVSFIIRLILCCVLLVAGHSLNIAMSVLSVIVHGVRLNILEFSSHLGMEWSGYKYEPLSEPAGKIEE
ncbi:MAG: ATPase, partial [Spirochaetaceae bacterium]|nr:ATPase [Spirochaetaceae bacterium]